MMRSRKQKNEQKPGKPWAVEVVEMIILVLIHLLTIAGLIDTFVQEGQRVVERFHPTHREVQPVNEMPPLLPKAPPLPTGNIKGDEAAKAMLVSG